MKNKTPSMPHFSLLLPLVGGAFFCTGCIPPHMEVPTATGEIKSPKQATPEKTHSLLEQHEVTVSSEEYSNPSIAVPTTTDVDDACFMLPDCPVDEPDEAASKAREFEKEFQHQTTKDQPNDKKRPSISLGSPVTRPEKEKISTGQTTEKDAQPTPNTPQNENINRLVELVELGSTIFTQTDEHGNLQAANTLFTESSIDGMMFAQQFSAPQTLEMLQDGTSYSIQAVNYVGVDFTT